MTLSIRSTGYYPAAQPRPAAPQQPAAAPYVVPMPTVRNDVMADSLQGVKDVVRAAMRGEAIAGESGLKARALRLIRKGQELVTGTVKSLMPASLQPTQAVTVQDHDHPMTPVEKAKKVAKAAIFFALPVAGAAGVAAGLGWLIGPLVPVVGSHVFGAVAGALAVGHTTGFLLHGSMRLPLVTKPEDREYNSAGATLGSAAIGAGLAGLIAAGAGATVGLPILAAGAAIGAAPRLVEWAIARI
ncbi:MAG: hypothetical protein ACLGIN_03550 [Candidatus Sericytochromatia bacterium]